MSSREQQRQLEEVRERDGNLCGHHYGGCGESVGSDATMDHIVPEKMLPPSARDNYIHFEARREAFSRSSGGWQKWLKNLNLQLMHKDCNRRKGSVFPDPFIDSRCECCRWFYGVQYQDGGIRPVMPGDDDPACDRGSHRILLMRSISILGEDKTVFVGIPFGPWFRGLRMTGETFGPVASILTYQSDGKVVVGGSRGTPLSLMAMRWNNVPLGIEGVKPFMERGSDVAEGSNPNQSEIDESIAHCESFGMEMSGVPVWTGDLYVSDFRRVRYPVDDEGREEVRRDVQSSVSLRDKAGMWYSGPLYLRVCGKGERLMDVSGPEGWVSRKRTAF